MRTNEACTQTDLKHYIHTGFFFFFFFFSFIYTEQRILHESACIIEFIKRVGEIDNMRGLLFLMHDVITLSDATSYDNYLSFNIDLYTYYMHMYMYRTVGY